MHYSACTFTEFLHFSFFCFFFCWSLLIIPWHRHSCLHWGNRGSEKLNGLLKRLLSFCFLKFSLIRMFLGIDFKKFIWLGVCWASWICTFMCMCVYVCQIWGIFSHISSKTVCVLFCFISNSYDSFSCLIGLFLSPPFSSSPLFPLDIFLICFQICF